MKRTLSLKSETLAALTGEELASVQGGLPTFGGLFCYVVNPSEARCTHTLLEPECRHG